MALNYWIIRATVCIDTTYKGSANCLENWFAFSGQIVVVEKTSSILTVYLIGPPEPRNAGVHAIDRAF